MSLNHVYCEKDKRLLVLLALGALIIICDFTVPVQYKPTVHTYTWMEVQDDENRLYRFESNDLHFDTTVNVMVASREIVPVQITDKKVFNRIKQGRAIALQEQDLATALMYASPRLAFFLGQPFSINIAGADDLALIQGVGPVLAGNIIAYREEYGPITEPSQLQDIPGIGPRMKLKLLNYLPCTLDCD